PCDLVTPCCCPVHSAVRSSPLRYEVHSPVTTHSFFSLFFFFYCSGHHRDLHSFPTRRSSDLRSPTISCSSSPASITLFGIACRRSEEHTSELQSHLNLVCRLLLEKKKKEIPATHHYTDQTSAN